MKKVVIAAAVSALAMSSVAYAGGPVRANQESAVAAPSADASKLPRGPVAVPSSAAFGAGAAVVPVVAGVVAMTALVAAANDSGSNATTTSQ